MALSARSRQWWVERVQHRGVLRRANADACRSTGVALWQKKRPRAGERGGANLEGFYFRPLGALGEVGSINVDSYLCRSFQFKA